MGIDYILVCEECETKANVEIHNYIHPSDEKMVIEFLNNHLGYDHTLRIIDSVCVCNGLGQCSHSQYKVEK